MAWCEQDEYLFTHLPGPAGHWRADGILGTMMRSFFEFSLCLSRVCLGKTIIYIQTWLKKSGDRFSLASTLALVLTSVFLALNDEWRQLRTYLKHPWRLCDTSCFTSTGQLGGHGGLRVRFDCRAALPGGILALRH
jgi:hypothetical protein